MSTEPSQHAQRVPAVVLGLGQNGLATVRALGRAGIPVFGIDSNCEQPTAQSRYCRAIPCPEFRQGGKGLLRTLEELGRTLPERPVLFPSGDVSLTLVSEERDRLARHFRFRLPEAETIRLVLDKADFQRFAEANGIPMARMIQVTPDLDPASVASTLRFPCIVKPLQPNAAWRRSFRDRKLFECRNADELVGTVGRLRAIHPDLLIQELIPGPEDRLEFSLTYLDERGEPLGMFTGRKIRQYPPRFGTSCLAESRWIPEVAELTRRILKALDYRGYGSVEFKRHPDDGGLRAIEVTARTWFPHGLATACGMNLPLLAYREILGLPFETVNRFREGVRWIHEERDLKVALAAWRRGELSLRDWLASYAGPRTYALAAADDPGPIIALGRKVLGSGGRALRRVFHRSAASTPAPKPSPIESASPFAGRKDAA